MNSRRFMRLPMAVFSALLLASLCSGCATDMWQPVRGPNVHREFSQHLSFDVPPNWVELVVPARFERVDITRDGPGLQWITVEFRPSPNVAPELSQAIGTAPKLLHVVEWEQALTLREPGLQNAVLNSTQMSTLAGHDAVVMEYQFRSAVGTDYRRIAYACVTDRGYFRAWLQAPVGHYLDNARPAMENLIKSVRWP